MTIQYSRIKRFVSITQAPKKISARFLYYFCLCKSFKELFLYSLAPSFEAKADAKVRLFSETPKHFEEKFHFYTKKNPRLDINQVSDFNTPYIIL